MSMWQYWPGFQHAADAVINDAAVPRGYEKNRDAEGTKDNSDRVSDSVARREFAIRKPQFNHLWPLMRVTELVQIRTKEYNRDVRMLYQLQTLKSVDTRLQRTESIQICPAEHCLPMKHNILTRAVNVWLSVNAYYRRRALTWLLINSISRRPPLIADTRDHYIEDGL
jgi:hypothetical protein